MKYQVSEIEYQGKTYRANIGAQSARNIERNYNAFVSDGQMRVKDEEAWNKVRIFVKQTEEKIQAQAEEMDWRNHPATDRQIAYLVSLGVDVDRPLTKGLASEIIDAVKSGDGVGQFGMTFVDGSN